MKMSILVLTLLAASSVSAQQTAGSIEGFLANVDSGNYTWNFPYYPYGYYSAPAGNSPFRILMKGTSIRLQDVGNKLAYTFNLSQSAPQPIPEAFLEFSRSRPQVSSVAKLVKGITVENIRPGTKENEVVGTFNVRLEYRSIFGEMSANIKFDGAVQAEKQNRTRYVNNQAGMQNYVATLLNYRIGSDTELAHFSTSFGEKNSKMLGLVLDVMLRLLAPTLGTSDNLVKAD